MRLFRKTLQTTSWSSTLAKYIAFVLLLLMWKGNAQAQDQEEAKKAALASIAKIENYPSVVFKGRFNRGQSSSEVEFSVRGVQVWNEYNRKQLDDPTPEKTSASQKKAREIMGSGDLKAVDAFDGENVYSFDPYNLCVSIKNSSKPVGFGSEISMLPINWLTFGNNGYKPFHLVLEGKNTPVQIDKLPDGRWKFSQIGMGKDLAKEIQEQLLMRERFIIVDPKLDFLVVEYSYTGGRGGRYS